MTSGERFRRCTDVVRDAGLPTDETVDLMIACHEQAQSAEPGMGTGFGAAVLLGILFAVPAWSQIKKRYRITRRDEPLSFEETVEENVEGDT